MKKERRSYLLFLFWPERSFCKRIPFLWCVSEPNIDYRIDVASFWGMGSKGNKRGGVEAIHNKSE